MDAAQNLQSVVQRNRRSRSGGVYAVCSAHPAVIDAAIQQAIADKSVLHVESTSSQVNPEGGYTGQTPEQFAAYIRGQAAAAGIPADQVLLGGDHLGPYPWRGEKASAAMEKACRLVRDCVLAGYQKIHLDASMACADDPQPAVPESVIAERAAVLGEAAEKAFAELPKGTTPPVYVIGTEVPVPGGETSHGSAPAVTTTGHVERTLQLFREAFASHGLSSAWERVIGLVVQPGVEFGDDLVFEYDRAKAKLLSEKLPADPQLVYEAHSTDYQSAAALANLVKDHFAILKVGPWLTFAYREAIFSLTAIERELLVESKGVSVSQIREALENVMLRKPAYWRPYYHGDEAQLRFSRSYSYSDRCRYYWPGREVQNEVEHLFKNLGDRKLPHTLISQYFPAAYEAVRAGTVPPLPHALVRDRIQSVLRLYASACGMSA